MTGIIIYSQSRTGSTLLVELLNDHPDIHCDQELLRSQGNEYFASKRLLNLVRIFPVPYLLYKQTSTLERIYGFKLLFYQIRRVRYLLALLDILGWKIIHLQRRNIVAQAVSNIAAMQRKQWHRYEGDPPLDEKLTINPSSLARELNKRKLWIAKEKELLGRIRHLDLFYEDDLMHKDSWSATGRKVSEFLQVPPFAPSKVSLQKTIHRPLSETIDNFEEVDAYLRRNGYADYLAP